MDLSYVCRGKQGHKVPSFLKLGAGLLTPFGTDVVRCLTVWSRKSLENRDIYVVGR